MHNALKEKLVRGARPLGTFVGTGSAAVVECLGCAGLDFVILDNEHSPVEAETTAAMVRAAQLRGVTPLARVREISRPAILKLLDVGVEGLIIPDVRSTEDVRRVVDYAKSIGCDAVTLNVWSGNDRALHFYEKCGFRPQKMGMELPL